MACFKEIEESQKKKFTHFICIGFTPLRLHLPRAASDFFYKPNSIYDWTADRNRDSGFRSECNHRTDTNGDLRRPPRDRRHA
jgi:hypothetical protein